MTIDLNGYRKTYKLRCAQPGAKTIEVTFPYVVVEREARKQGLTVPQFLERYYVIAEYDNFEGVHYTFKQTKGGDDKK